MGARKQLEFSARSIAHIESIKLEIASDDPGAAEKVVRSIFAAADHLEAFPKLGHIGRRGGTKATAWPMPAFEPLRECVNARPDPMHFCTFDP